MAHGGAAAQNCTSPTVDLETGLVLCAEGYAHRPTVRSCGNSGAGAVPAQGGASGTGGVDSSSLPRVADYQPCADDPSVCNAFQYGYCGVTDQALCMSGCVTDADCGSGQICLCGDAASPTGGSCQGSACTSDAACQPGQLCASYSSGCGGGYACQTPQDTCQVRTDCAASEVCQPGDGGQWKCSPTAVCGRPFLVDAQARLAPVLDCGAWSNVGEASPRLEHLDRAERAALAAHWARLGQMEHASIAAFARFSLQLLSLGAPPELVEACTRALGDETAHTKLCFRIASVYAGRALGPGPLDVAGSLALSSLADIVDLVIAEGCFGETSAALEALEAATSASDPVIRAAYSRIAVDEQRHAELAFQFVRWALVQEPLAVSERLQRARQQPLASHRLAWDVTLPCLDALLALHSAA